MTLLVLLFACFMITNGPLIAALDPFIYLLNFSSKSKAVTFAHFLILAFYHFLVISYNFRKTYLTDLEKS